jgi:hypothetical protein
LCGLLACTARRIGGVHLKGTIGGIARGITDRNSLVGAGTQAPARR